MTVSFLLLFYQTTIQTGFLPDIFEKSMETCMKVCESIQIDKMQESVYSTLKTKINTGQSTY